MHELLSINITSDRLLLEKWKFVYLYWIVFKKWYRIVGMVGYE